MTDKNTANSKKFKEKWKPPPYHALPNYTVTRKVLFQENVNDLGEYEKRDKDYLTNLKHSINEFSFIKFIYNLIPILKWIPNYSIRNQLVGDITAGITVAVMHIPQGMAYGLLAGVTPSSGLYMAFFPTLIYFVFGTSRHISVGTLSVISLMTLRIVQKHSIPAPIDPMHAIQNDTTMIMENYYTPMQVVTATAFMCGIHHLIMCFLQLGHLASLLSDSLINGFTTGAAVHVVVSQLKDLFGIKIKQNKGVFQILYTVYDCILAIPSSNNKTVIISLCIVIFMILMNEVIKPWANKKCRFPIPAELMAVVGGTLASHFLQLGPNYGVHLVGHIPLGLPAPEMPPLKLLASVAIDSIAISIVSYSVTMSMAMIFANKRNYEIRANQELFALGCSNIIGGLFSCVPNGTSLSRSLIQELTGGNTQMASVVSAILILIILLWIGPFFEVLPRCVLSGIILIALKGMFTQALQLKRFYREGKMETFTWIITFIAVIAFDIDIGLFMGFFVSLAALYMKGWKSEYALLGAVADTNVYVDLATHHKANELPYVKIFRYIGAINFATRTTFKHALYESIDMQHKKIRKASINRRHFDKNINSVDKRHAADDNENDVCNKLRDGTQSVILDLSCVPHIDIAACKTFTEVQKEMELFNIKLFITSSNDRVLNAIEHSVELGQGPFLLLPTIHDAVLYGKTIYSDNNNKTEMV